MSGSHTPETVGVQFNWFVKLVNEQSAFASNEAQSTVCLLYTSDAADEEDSVDLGGRRIIKKKKKNFFQAEDGIRDAA